MNESKVGKLLSDIKLAFLEFFMDVTESTELVDKLISTNDFARTFRNFPNNRGFSIKLQNARWIATDGNSIYWLNEMSERWVCMEGPDLKLPKDQNGDVNYTTEITNENKT